jgi:aminoglycoside 3-N-acetyltransferase
MPADQAAGRRPFVRRSTLAAGLRAIGVREGDVLFAHTSMRSLGWVVGGADTVVNALLDAVGPRGTVAAVASWSDIPLRMDEWEPARRLAYLEEMPGFDPDQSEANPLYGRLPERLRSWPGSRKSGHPDQRVIAIGARAAWLTERHPLDDSFGPGTPFERLVEARGTVLMLGAPLRSLTLLHHAEALARVPSKRRRTYALPFATPAGTEWRRLSDIDVEYGPLPYADVVAAVSDPLEGIAAMARCALAAGIGRRRMIAGADSHLFPAAALVRFAVGWLEERFSPPPQERHAKHSGGGKRQAQRDE